MTAASRRLIVNADDFGRSAGINAAVIRAHREGILTTTSLMVNEAACAEAVSLARENPRLGVGLHLALVHGQAALSPAEVPGLVDGSGRFTRSPVAAGWSYFLNRGLRRQLRGEIQAQFRKFRDTGLPLDHVNGHLHLHLHPVVLDLLREDAAVLGIERMRLTHDPFRLNLKLARGHLVYRSAHALLFRFLSGRAAPRFRQHRIRHTRYVFGLLQNAHVDEDYITRLLPELPPGDSELYSHPSLDEFRHEFDALVSPRVRRLVDRLGIELIRYCDL